MDFIDDEGFNPHLNNNKGDDLDVIAKKNKKIERFLFSGLGIIFIVIILIGAILYKQLKDEVISYNNATESMKATGNDKKEILIAYYKYLSAEKQCDKESVNELLTKDSLSVVRLTCANMLSEMKCYENRDYKIAVSGNSGVVYLIPFSQKIENPIFFTKENSIWKVDLKKMSEGLTMSGSSCDSGWSWRNEKLKEEFLNLYNID